jgi:hypothetical protein
MLEITERREQILRLLGMDVRLATIEDHLAPLFLAHTKHPIHNARIELRQLESAGYLETMQVMLSLPQDFRKPLFAWHPNDPPATPKHLARIAWRNSTRWGPPERRTAVIPTAKTKALFGGNARPLRSRDIAHDAAVTTYYVAHFHPNKDGRFIPEDALAAAGWDGELVPDALMMDEKGGYTALEIVGSSYTARKLQSIDKYYRSRNLTYVLA